MIVLWTWLAINLIFSVYAIVEICRKRDWFYFTIFPLLWMPLSETKTGEFWFNLLTCLFIIVFFPFLFVYWLLLLVWLVLAVVMTYISKAIRGVIDFFVRRAREKKN